MILENIMSNVFLSVIIGGRLGYVILYQETCSVYDAIAIWNGGMAAYGGFIAGFVTLYFQTKRYKMDLILFLNTLVLYLPIGLFFGRLANLINGEIQGKMLTATFRHPIAIYNMFAEGIVIFILMWLNRKYSFMSMLSMFLMSYGFSRLIIDNFREVESAMCGVLTYGQVMGIILILLSATLVIFEKRNKNLK